jgi:glyoxylase-like metal-dependent hydrolase (beta-lactamase superfamily II)
MRERSRFLILLLSFLVAGPLAAQSFDEIEVETVSLGGSLHLVSRAGGNIAALTGPDGVLLVDAGFTQMEPKLRAAVAALSDEPVRYVLNTHWHFDHVGGNEALAESGAVIIAHENIRKTMSSGLHLAVLDRDVPASTGAALPAVTFKETLRLHVNGEEIEIIHIPGAHTGGDGVVRFRNADVVHAGDIFFNCGYPFIDINDGGSIGGMIGAVEKILALCDDDTRIIPGHGPLAAKKDLEEYLAMLRGYRDAVAAEAAAGKDLEAILAGGATAALDEKYGKVFFPPDKFTELVFRSLP